MASPTPLSTDEVRRVARLARLDPGAADVERYCAQLATIIEYVAQISELDVQVVEPLTHPGLPAAHANRLDHDDPQPALPLQALAKNAPAMEGPFLAVPKVIGGGSAEGA